MDRSMKFLASIGGIMVIAGTSSIIALTTHALDTGGWSLLAVLLAAAFILGVVTGLAIVSSVLVDYSYMNGWREGYADAERDLSERSDDSIS